MKSRLILIFLFFILISCYRDEFADFYSARINFSVSERIFSEKVISCIDFDLDGNAWIGSGSDLIRYKNGKIKTYKAGSEIMDISVGDAGKIWLGTKEKGLACFENEKFIYYTMENSGLPRNLIIDVEAAPDGSLWFSCSAHQIGGLMHFDGQQFELYTPENSISNRNLILGIQVDNNSNVFCFSGGTVTEAKVFKIDNKNNWYKLGGDVSFYWIASMDITSGSEVVVATDHSLSSCRGCYEDNIFIYRDGNWEIIETEFDSDALNRMFVDKRDYIWAQGVTKEGNSGYFVYDGKKWQHSGNKDLFDAFVYSAKVDPDNNIWFCTNKGIFILNQ